MSAPDVARERDPAFVPVLRAGRLYLGDNGRCTCGEHAGSTARFTGYDLSGLRMLAITPAIAQRWVRECHRLPACETCGRLATVRTGSAP